MHSESEEVSIEKVVHLFKSFKTIFFFIFFELGQGIFGVVKVLSNLEPFELI
jgi:hypothetical protein